MKYFYERWLTWIFVSGVILFCVHFFEGYRHPDWDLCSIWLLIGGVTAACIAANSLDK